jgi:hypothetical protein
MKEAADKRGRLNEIALALECGCCFEKLGAGSVSFGCGHTYCNRPDCASRSVETCPECRQPVTTRVELFGALPDVGGLLQQEPEGDVEQTQELKQLLLEVAKQSQHPRAFKVVANLMKQLADVNLQLLDLQKQKQNSDAPKKRKLDAKTVTSRGGGREEDVGGEGGGGSGEGGKGTRDAQASVWVVMRSVTVPTCMSIVRHRTCRWP